MRDYEMVVVISPGVADENIPTFVERWGQFISGKGGEVTNVDHWGRRRLAYPINRFSEGNYVLARFKAEPPVVEELEANLRLNEEVIRHLVVRLDE